MQTGSLEIIIECFYLKFCFNFVGQISLTPTIADTNKNTPNADSRNACTTTSDAAFWKMCFPGFVHLQMDFLRLAGWRPPPTTTRDQSKATTKSFWRLWEPHVWNEHQRKFMVHRGIQTNLGNDEGRQRYWNGEVWANSGPFMFRNLWLLESY